jgi:glutamate-ammonia-ligase adenylyltransferase
LCKGATDLEPILHSFQDKELLRVGVRDILNKDTIQDTTAALSDLAETILVQLVAPLQAPLLRRYGTPRFDPGEPGRAPRQDAVVAATPAAPCRFCVLALGKLGARELSYHSDLDLMMIYEADGRTGPPAGASRHDRYELTDNFHFFTELGQRLIRSLSQMGPLGRLYQVDMRLRPTGRSGSLVLPLDEFRRYFGPGPRSDFEGGAQLWERQMLTRARVVYGEADFAARVMAAVAEGIWGQPWQPAWASEVADMRERLEASRPARDLKRGPGGLADVEFLVQLFQLAHGRDRPALRVPNTWQALAALRAEGLLDEAEHQALKEGYDFLLRVQSRLRIVHNRTLDAVPESPADVEKLARRLGFDGGGRFLAHLEEQRDRLREQYRRLLARGRGS